MYFTYIILANYHPFLKPKSGAWCLILGNLEEIIQKLKKKKSCLQYKDNKSYRNERTRLKHHVQNVQGYNSF